MKLTDLNKFNQIVIQIHDNPDADAVGSGYAIYKYLKSLGKDVRLVYGGKNSIQKSNMRMLVEELEIPVEHISRLDPPELLLTVDCQYGQGNVQHFDAENIAMIDHHNTGKISDSMAEIRSNLVSCATICYSMLRNVNYDINADSAMATALYYGLYMDSDHFSEIRHPLELDMMDFLSFDKVLLARLKHANFNIEELSTAGVAITGANYREKYRMAIVGSAPCDPNILGVIGDFVIQVDTIDVCVTYNQCSGGYKLSVRSCVQEVAANELAAFLAEGIGSGGGHLDKAGGFIGWDSFTEKYPGITLEKYLEKRVEEYYGSYDTVYWDKPMENPESFTRYKKKKAEGGYVKTTDLFPAGTQCKIRTLEGDVFVKSGDDIYIMIGDLGNVYPIQQEIFDAKYDPVDEPYSKEFDYPPSVVNSIEGRSYNLLPFAKKWVTEPYSTILAKPLERYTKVFTKWDYDGYMTGEKGDMLCYSDCAEGDVYIFDGKIFLDYYEKIE